MKKILILGSLLILPILIFANVSLDISSKRVSKGESVTFRIQATGDNIKFPKIDKINNYLVKVTSDSTNLVYQNGKMSVTKIKEYTFTPDTNVTIPSFKVIVDNKEYKTAPIYIIVDKNSVKTTQKPVELKISANKKEVFLGEPIELTIKLKIKNNSNIAKAQLEEPHFPNFWVKYLNNGVQKEIANTTIQEYKLLLFPQKDGNLTINNIVADIAVPQNIDSSFDDDLVNNFFQTFHWEKISSNSLNIKVKPLPNNLELYGDFNIEAKVDKQKVYSNKPINLTIKVKGFGNIDDIKKFDINIANGVVYSDEPIIKSFIKNGKYGGEFKQKVAIIADSNYTIPSIKLKYFSAKEKIVKTITTKPINIEVIGGSKNESKTKIETSSINSSLKNKTIVKKEIPKSYYLWIVLAFILGVITTLTFNSLKRKKLTNKKESNIIKNIKRAKSDKELFKLLLPYSKEDKFIKTILKELEKNIYKNSNNNINKKEIIEYFEDLEDFK